MVIRNHSPIRILVIDDSPTIRELFTALFQEAGDIVVVGTGATGEDAVRLTKLLKPDLVSMDIRMPLMNGLEATRRIMSECPVPIVLISTEAEKTHLNYAFQALQAGALTVIGKPSLSDPASADKVIQTIRAMARVPVIRHWNRKEPEKMDWGLAGGSPKGWGDLPDKNPIAQRLREASVLGVASSTGGPGALASLFQKLPSGFPLPVLVVQHISFGFTAGLVDWLGTQTKLSVEIAAQGGRLKPGTVLFAPDDFHFQIGESRQVELTKAPRFKGLRPSANYLFESLARQFGSRAAGMVLTGMGDDGAQGLKLLHQAGGLTFAQDEASSVVFGMPREAVLQEAVDHVMSLDQLSSLLEKIQQL